jgi:hypothetical protein
MKENWKCEERRREGEGGGRRERERNLVRRTLRTDFPSKSSYEKVSLIKDREREEGEREEKKKKKKKREERREKREGVE